MVFTSKADQVISIFESFLRQINNFNQIKTWIAFKFLIIWDASWKNYNYSFCLILCPKRCNNLKWPNLILYNRSSMFWIQLTSVKCLIQKNWLEGICSITITKINFGVSCPSLYDLNWIISIEPMINNAKKNQIFRNIDRMSKN